MRYALKIKSNPDNAVYDSIFKLRYSHLYHKEDSTDCLSLGESIKNLFRESDIDRSRIITSKIPDTPIWKSEPNHVSFKLSIYDKSSTSNELFKMKFDTEILPEYHDDRHIYTDGSKKAEKATIVF